MISVRTSRAIPAASFPRPPQDAADAVAPGDPAERLEDPLPELLQRPAVAGQAVLGGGAVLDDLGDLPGPGPINRGARPPVRRSIRASGPCALSRWTQP